MTHLYAAAVLLLALALSEQGVNCKHFVNEWAAEITGGREVAKRVAKEHGYEIAYELEGLPDHYVLKRSDVPHRSRRSAHHHTSRLEQDHRVTFVEQQHEKIRVKRGYLREPEESEGNSRWNRDLAREIIRRGGSLDDPNFPHEWYLNPSDSNKRDSAAADLRVHGCWKKGLTGKNVVLSILDDGLEKNHTDIKDNYDPEASYDINDKDPDPQPRYDITDENKHGTRCAGEIAMVANNGVCGVGVAFDSKIGGIRMLDGRVTDSSEAFSLSFHREHIDIYSASWGPNDDGKTTEKPGKLVQKALEDGVTKGRGGKGSIFAWASGNGGRVGDNCNSDGYTGSIYTLSISTATQLGHSPWYAEKCSSTLASAYSSGAMNEGKVTTADIRNRCTGQHTGTSAAAPLAAGIIALLLEANPELTWREVQHVTLHSARMEPLSGEKGWYRNAAGYCVNLAFGFGLMDALAMAEMVDPATWVPVGEQHICKVEINKTSQLPMSLKSGGFVEVEFTTDGCKGQANEVNFLEHVEIILNLDYERRGAIYAELESPSGTITSLMQERHYDHSRAGFQDFPLMSVHTWGENPCGTWKFRVADKSDQNYSGQLKNAKLIMYGTEEMPAYRKKDPKDCQGVTINEDPTRAPVPAEKQTIKEMLDETVSYLRSTSQHVQGASSVQEELRKLFEDLKN
ncbi:neuroendocrine convertase 1 [Plakobranchus ocellatus]|uniref:Neuroendocrine convertase 1 n=1 Tax=Plakobranchus ocellatus TaxID=259542 RepID=A0AAV4B1Z8_9GAST|nr:neuroendocrine convertase 1 [Plakobranchus ocellatus]